MRESDSMKYLTCKTHDRIRYPMDRARRYYTVDRQKKAVAIGVDARVKAADHAVSMLRCADDHNPLL